MRPELQPRGRRRASRERFLNILSRFIQLKNSSVLFDSKEFLSHFSKREDLIRLIAESESIYSTASPKIPHTNGGGLQSSCLTEGA